MIRFVVLFFIFSYTSFAQSSLESYTGVWQDSPVMASDRGDTYCFFADGSFIFHSSRMDALNRVRGYSGKWNVTGGYMLTRARTSEA